MLLARNIRHLRRVAGLNQTAFGNLFNFNRGNIDSYEREICAPPLEFLTKVSAYFKISLNDLTGKDLTDKVGLTFDPGLLNEDLLKAKDETIRELRKQITFLQSQLEILTKNKAKNAAENSYNPMPVRVSPIGNKKLKPGKIKLNNTKN